MGGMSWEPRVSIALYCTVLHNAWEYFGEQKMTIGFSIIRISAMHPGLCSPQRKESEHYFATTHSLSPHQLDHSSLLFAIRWVIVGGEAPPSSFFTSLRGYFCFPLPSKWGQGSKGHIFCQGGPGMSSSSAAGICSACSSVGSMIDFFLPPPGDPSPGREASCLGTTPSPLSPSLFPVVSQFVARRRRETNFFSSPRGSEDCLRGGCEKWGAMDLRGEAE